MSDEALYDLIQQHRWAVMPRERGGWIVRKGDRVLAMTNTTLRAALRLALKAGEGVKEPTFLAITIDTLERRIAHLECALEAAARQLEARGAYIDATDARAAIAQPNFVKDSP